MNYLVFHALKLIFHLLLQATSHWLLLSPLNILFAEKKRFPFDILVFLGLVDYLTANSISGFLSPIAATIKHKRYCIPPKLNKFINLSSPKYFYPWNHPLCTLHFHLSNSLSASPTNSLLAIQLKKKKGLRKEEIQGHCIWAVTASFYFPLVVVPGEELASLGN